MIDSSNKLVLNINCSCAHMIITKAIKLRLSGLNSNCVRSDNRDLMAFLRLSRARYAIVDADDSSEYQKLLSRVNTNNSCFVALCKRLHNIKFSDIAHCLIDELHTQGELVTYKRVMG